jgi:CDP-diacylglycerol--glycerol-3-phosphate 3-phosphatidyltransferase
MNLPNKITIGRIIMSVIIIAILLFPFEAMGISTMKFFVNESLVIDIKYLIAGVLFIIASLSDFVDGYIARKYNLVTDFGKMTDAIADKMLVNSVLIILASTGFISAIIPVVVVLRDTVVDVIKMIVGNKGKAVAAIKSGKIKTACLMTGITLTLFYNLPFELINIRVSDILLIIATVMSIISGVQYYTLNKKNLFD